MTQPTPGWYRDPSGGAAARTYVVLFDPSFRLSSGRIGWINQI
jgi:hypothetical protein